MSKASIIIIIFCTALVAVVVFFSLRDDSGMKDIYLTGGEDFQDAALQHEETVDFHYPDSSIYLVIPLNDVQKGDIIDVEWVAIGKNGQKTVQKDFVEIEDKGSGYVAIYFLKRDSAYTPGDYIVRAEYNDIQKKEAAFTIFSVYASDL